ncbi:MAG: type II toxin-antitoxin system VapC family toxin [Ignavibacteria bacterium]|jgi:hypothetical protein|nr:type II toxin-antitoxin system VapC family toxin [Ignavibacteria bacterium]
MGDKNAALKRLEAVRDLPDLGYSPNVQNLAIKYIDLFRIPEKARLDAFHLAYAVLFKIDFLLSWNCKHIANELVNLKLKNYNINNSLYVPFLCTAHELLEV